uniref:Helicase C-terminal domain-containing protein n=1 Tax=Macrostomum lignano TaxID=282301 RepID=A0A1I8IH25_9PLAT
MAMRIFDAARGVNKEAPRNLIWRNRRRQSRRRDFEREDNRARQRSVRPRPVVAARPPAHPSRTQASSGVKLVPVTQQFIVRDNLQLRAALEDPEDRRINSIGQRHGCLITVQDRTRRLGHNAHRVVVCAPDDKTLRMCARSLDKAMGWDLNSQLAYAMGRGRAPSAAAVGDVSARL